MHLSVGSCALLAGAVCAGVAAPVGAQNLLSQGTISGGFGVSHPTGVPFTGISLELIVDVFSPGSGVFGTFGLTPGDVGSTYTATSINDPNFGAVTGLLSNGVSNQVFSSGRMYLPTLSGGGAAFTYSESTFFTSPPPLIDFIGSTIGEIRVRLDALTLFETVDQMSGQQVTNATYTATYSVYDNVPGPGGAIVLAAGAVMSGRRPTRRCERVRDGTTKGEPWGLRAPKRSRTKPRRIG